MNKKTDQITFNSVSNLNFDVILSKQSFKIQSFFTQISHVIVRVFYQFGEPKNEIKLKPQIGKII